MGNEFNGMKFDYWSDEENNEYGVWNNDMKAKQYMENWGGNFTNSKEEAIQNARRLNKNAGYNVKPQL